MIEPSTPATYLLALLREYVSRYGKGLFSIINYPEISREKLVIYLDSLRITLKRHGKVPVYLWLHEPELKRYQLFLFTNGYFTHDLSEILPILTRLWLIHSNIPIQIQSWSIVDADNMNTVANDLASLDWQPRPATAAWHQRMFGTSQI